MKKISLKGIKETLSEKELKNVMGGTGSGNCPSNCCRTTIGTLGKCHPHTTGYSCLDTCY